jgi:PucR-like helix-turn-helix protein/diguanylate cyclase with GGDEF domain
VPEPSAARIAATARRLEELSGTLSTRALGQMDESLPWFGTMAPLARSQVGVLVQAGIRGFADWLRDPDAGPKITADVFATAPPEFARVVTLEQTVELVRIAVAVTEAAVDEFATESIRPWAHDATLRYSREIAFAAALVYARAAEQRGAWDARLEALVVDAIVRGDVSDSVLSRASALGWGAPDRLVVMAGAPAYDDTERSLMHARRLGHDNGADLLAGLASGRLVLVVGLPRRSARVIKALVPAFGDGPVVRGPEVDGLDEAARSVQDVLAGLRSALGWPDAPRPVASGDLLPERALIGDSRAATTLVAAVHAPIAGEPALLETADAFVRTGGNIAATARELYVHANTVRYRVGRIAELTGWDITAARDRYVVQVGLALGRLDSAAAAL